ncbi:Hypothetical predicted protein [Xyrichtys novacula]|uniref:Uncharacterized protein n=1 Tax=Xyrichtys novacula TaxID=13765 RepID=A0AAV1GJT4_XYRNO|nr:Hypothetical predicted protein [Xyrichtys novacula]
MFDLTTEHQVDKPVEGNVRAPRHRLINGCVQITALFSAGVKFLSALTVFAFSERD